MRPTLSFLLVCLALLVPSGVVLSQDISDSAQFGSGNTLVPLPVFFYQPETGWGFGAAVGYYFRIGSGETRAPQTSELGAVAIYTTKKQIIASLSSQLYLRGGDLRVRGGASYIEFPTSFWGIGNEAPEDAEEEYTPRTLSFSAEVQRAVAQGWLVGATLQIANRQLLEVEEGGLLASGNLPGAEDGRIVLAGAAFIRDSRSSTVFPERGSYLQARAAGASHAIGSEFGFAAFTLDLRKYFPTFPGHVAAFRALGQATTGTPPFELLPQLGGDVLLRGYFAGRFRDQTLLAFQAEYRFPVWWRIGLVGFAEAGQVAPDARAFRSSGFKTSLGGGLRFALSQQERLNIRADFGWGFDVDSGGFYLGISEAF